MRDQWWPATQKIGWRSKARTFTCLLVLGWYLSPSFSISLHDISRAAGRTRSTFHHTKYCFGTYCAVMSYFFLRKSPILSLFVNFGRYPEVRTTLPGVGTRIKEGNRWIVCPHTWEQILAGMKVRYRQIGYT